MPFSPTKEKNDTAKRQQDNNSTNVPGATTKSSIWSQHEHIMYRRLEVPADADILICAGDACEGFDPVDLQNFFA